MNNLHILLTPCVNESRVLKIASSIRSLGVADSVYVAALHEHGLECAERLAPGVDLQRFDLSSRSLPKNPFFQMAKLIEYAFRIWRHYRGAAVEMVNIHSFELLPVGVALKYLYGAKLVYDTHELETEQDNSEGFRKKFSRVLERTFIRYVDHTFVVSEGIADEYVNMYGIARPDVVLNCPRYTLVEKTTLLRDELEIPAEAIIFIYLGGLAEGRGIEITLEAFKSMSDTKCVIVYMGYGPLATMVKEAAAESATVFYHAAVPPKDVLRYAASADVGISFIENTCKSYFLCLPNKLFEFVMAGLPVIVSNMIEMSRFVRERRIGVVAEDETRAGIVDAIEELARMDLSELRAAAIETAQLFNWEAQEIVLERAYERLLGNDHSN